LTVSFDGPHPPLPPADLDSRHLDVETLGPCELWRISWPGKALFWSPESGKPPRGRFDDPGGGYRVHYSALTFDGAFVEALLRQEQMPYLAWSDIASREIAALRLSRPLRVIPLLGHHLAQLRATAAVASGPYGVSRSWSHALFQWRDDDGPVDGLLYPSRHDDEQRCLALFDRAAGALEVVSTDSLGARREDIVRLRRRYRFPLDLGG
jgi:hypothetical protein